MSHEQDGVRNGVCRKSSLSLGSNLHLPDKDPESLREYEEQLKRSLAMSRSFIGPKTITRRDTCLSFITLDGSNFSGRFVRSTRSSRISRISRMSRFSRLSDMLSEDMTYSWFCFLALIVLFFISIFLVSYIVHNW